MKLINKFILILILIFPYQIEARSFHFFKQKEKIDKFYPYPNNDKIYFNNCEKIFSMDNFSFFLNCQSLQILNKNYNQPIKILTNINNNVYIIHNFKYLNQIEGVLKIEEKKLTLIDPQLSLINQSSNFTYPKIFQVENIDLYQPHIISKNTIKSFWCINFIDKNFFQNDFIKDFFKGQDICIILNSKLKLTNDLQIQEHYNPEIKLQIWGEEILSGYTKISSNSIELVFKSNQGIPIYFLNLNKINLSYTHPNLLKISINLSIKTLPKFITKKINKLKPLKSSKIKKYLPKIKKLTSGTLTMIISNTNIELSFQDWSKIILIKLKYSSSKNKISLQIKLFDIDFSYFL